MSNKSQTPSAEARKLQTTLVVTDSESFSAFDQSMTVALDELVARWIHTAAPNARRIGLGLDFQRRGVK